MHARGCNVHVWARVVKSVVQSSFEPDDFSRACKVDRRRKGRANLVRDRILNGNGDGESNDARSAGSMGGGDGADIAFITRGGGHESQRTELIVIRTQKVRTRTNRL